MHIGPCLPQNVRATAYCNSTSTVVTSWDRAEGAQTYTVEARGNRNDFYNCTSLNSSCTLSDLECGESLSVWIVATDGNCTTDPVMGETAETGKHGYIHILGTVKYCNVNTMVYEYTLTKKYCGMVSYANILYLSP